jgi:hypothetical protein
VTTALVVLAAALAASIGLGTALAVWLRSATRAAAELRDRVLAEERRGDALLTERDGYAREAGQRSAERDEARRLLTAATARLRRFEEGLANVAADQIRRADDPRAALVRALGGVPAADAAGPAAAGGDRAAPAVRPAPDSSADRGRG